MAAFFLLDPPSVPNPDISSILAGLIQEASELIPKIVTQLETGIFSYLVWIAQVVGGFALIWSLLRELKASEGASPKQFYWFVRTVIMMFLLVTTTPIINYMMGIGYTVAYGTDRGQNSVIEAYIQDQRTKFDFSYQEVFYASFLVEMTPDGPDVKPEESIKIRLPDGKEKTVTGVPTMAKFATYEEISKGMNPSAWTPGMVANCLWSSAMVLKFSDLFLLVLTPFIMIAFRLAAPYMIAVSVDRETARRTGVPFLWSLSIFSLAFPTISQVFRAVAYTLGNWAFNAFPSTTNYPVFNDGFYYTFTSENGSIIGGNYPPLYGAMFCTICFFIIALMMLASPYISIRLAKGEVFEAVTGIASSWMGSLLSTGIGVATAGAASELGRQAAETTALAGYQTGVEGQNASLAKEVNSLNANRLMQQAATDYGASKSIQQFNIQNSLSNNGLVASRDRDVRGAGIQRDNATASAKVNQGVQEATSMLQFLQSLQTLRIDTSAQQSQNGLAALNGNVGNAMTVPGAILNAASPLGGIGGGGAKPGAINGVSGPGGSFTGTFSMPTGGGAAGAGVLGAASSIAQNPFFQQWFMKAVSPDGRNLIERNQMYANRIAQDIYEGKAEASNAFLNGGTMMIEGEPYEFQGIRDVYADQFQGQRDVALKTFDQSAANAGIYTNQMVANNNLMRDQSVANETQFQKRMSDAIGTSFDQQIGGAEAFNRAFTNPENGILAQTRDASLHAARLQVSAQLLQTIGQTVAHQTAKAFDQLRY